ncbi:MAG: DUF805 domain-containing protein [Chloroflexi bacterium]|nr:DUF805 domain-containing protein [Chloroflexota bacterium]
MTIWRTGSRVLRQTFDYSGRASRADFWWWMRLLFRVLLVSFVAMVAIDVLIARVVLDLGTLLSELVTSGVLIIVVGFFPTVALAVRRLHDIGRSGASVLAWFVFPLLAWIVCLGIGYVTFSIGFVGGDPSVIPTYASLGVALVITLGVACRAIWLLSRNGEDGPNRFGDARR